nr:ABC-three component system middle component 2 [Bradyrhizobium sp. RP6]
MKRDVISAGLDEMFSRELLQKTFDASGILYCATELTAAFIALLKTDYATSLRERADWVIKKFGEMQDEELSRFMTNNVGRWGAEFDRLTAVNDLEL